MQREKRPPEDEDEDDNNNNNSKKSKSNDIGWKRPELPPLESMGNLIFQMGNIDYTIGRPLEGMPGMTRGSVPILRLFGVNAGGNSIQCNVHGFAPYFMINYPSGFREDMIGDLKNALNTEMRTRYRHSNARQGLDEEPDSNGISIIDYIVGIETIPGSTIMSCENNLSPFLKIYLAIPPMVPTCRTICEEGVRVADNFFKMQTYESNVLFVLRFMADKEIKGSSWVEIPQDKYRLPISKTSNCQLEVDVSHEDIISHKPEGEWAKNAPFRILSFDIECAGRRGIFPEPQADPVIQIANVMNDFGSPSSSDKRNVFVLRGCGSIIGSTVLPFEKEADMLLAWKRFVVEYDPDIIIGYNHEDFDFPYLEARAKHLKLNDFKYISRVRSSPLTIKNGTFKSKAYGAHETKEPQIRGRTSLDLLIAIQRDHKLRSYTLNSVSAHFLGEQKEDVHHSMITKLHNGTDDDRRRLAVYCIKDACLPKRLLDKLMILNNLIEMARVTGVPEALILRKGQTIKVIAQLLEKTGPRNIYIPTIRPSSDGEDDEGYEGAIVIPPQKGFYDTCIITLDFESLYPRIMWDFNLCYTTYIRPEDLHKYKPEDYTITPGLGHAFLKATVKKGILPEIVENLLMARKATKRLLAAEKDPSKRAVYDGRQLALKISANSVYGFTGARYVLPLIAISATVTAWGRIMIETTKKIVESRFCIANGFPTDCKVIYGDTDSVMVNTFMKDIRQAMKEGPDMAVYVTEKLLSDLNLQYANLQFEKIYFPYLLLIKKRYAGLLWMKPDKYDKLDAKGIETVRRDNCLMVKNMLAKVLDFVLLKSDVESAKAHVKSTVSDLMAGKIDISQLVISKSLSRTAGEYKSKQAHAELVEKMRSRDASSAPKLGDRVPYIYIAVTDKKAKAYEKVEDPLYVLNNNIPIDYQHYLKKQVEKPVLRIFDSIMENPRELIYGNHTLQRVKTVPKIGGILAFAKKLPTCMGCSVKIPGGVDAPLCHDCEKDRSEIYMEKLEDMRGLEDKFSRLWTQCQTCQGSVAQEVICSNKDCPIFYSRIVTKDKLARACSEVERFELPPIAAINPDNNNNNNNFLEW